MEGGRLTASQHWDWGATPVAGDSGAPWQELRVTPIDLARFPLSCFFPLAWNSSLHHFCLPIVSIFCTLGSLWSHCGLTLVVSKHPTESFFLDTFLSKFPRKKWGLTQVFCVCTRLWNELLTSLLTGHLLVRDSPRDQSALGVGSYGAKHNHLKLLLWVSPSGVNGNDK